MEAFPRGDLRQPKPLRRTARDPGWHCCSGTQGFSRDWAVSILKPCGLNGDNGGMMGPWLCPSRVAGIAQRQAVHLEPLTQPCWLPKTLSGGLRCRRQQQQQPFREQVLPKPPLG